MVYVIRMVIGRFVLEKLFQLIQEEIVCAFFFYCVVHKRSSRNLKLNSCHILESVGEVDVDGWVISSESCGFLSIGARYVREVCYSLPYEIKRIIQIFMRLCTFL